jgi:hypothetical protein
MASSIAQWWDAFLQHVQNPAQAAPLKEASLSAKLTEWTRLTTEAVVRSCEAMTWEVAARGHRLDRLPEVGEEYLAIDAMAFPARQATGFRWPLPAAVFELENSPRNDRVAYSLWKLLCVRAGVRVVFAYRQTWEQSRQLVEYLTTDVVAGLPVEDRMGIAGETAVVTGSRGEGETFPYGYFKLWTLDMNLGRFSRE